MGRLGENIHAERKRVILELMKGKKMATKLQTLLQKPVKDHGSVSVEDLGQQILRSFTETLFLLSSCAGSTQIAAVDGGGSDCSGAGKKKPGVKGRRGCYKRRRTSDSWMQISRVVEDGYAWRKYGQKNILNSEYPRCYFRCTHKYQGCKATKQVQRIKDNPIFYQTTYFNHHTCIDKLRAPPLFTGSDPVEPDLLSFETNHVLSQLDYHDPTNHMIKKEDTQSSEDVCDRKSNLDPLQEIIGSESLGRYKPIWAPLMMSSYEEGDASGFYSYGSTSLHGLDVEVDQLGDIDSFHFDEIYST